MQTLLLGIFTLALLVAAAYAQRRIATFTYGTANIFIARTVLLVVGIIFGWMTAGTYEDSVSQLLRFFMGFGIVHLPAAVILYIKGRRGAGKS